MEPARLRMVLTIFVLMTPLGIFLGTSSSSFLQGESAEISVVGVFNALAAGTFIYVAVMDVIVGEMGRLEDRIVRFASSALAGNDDVPMPVEDTDRTLKFLLVLGSMALLGIWV